MGEILQLLGIGLTAAGGVFGYVKSRQFVRNRLRFVDAAQDAKAPWMAGLAAVAVAAPVVWLLPVIGAGTAVIFGAGVGVGVSHGAKDVRRISGPRS